MHKVVLGILLFLILLAISCSGSGDYKDSVYNWTGEPDIINGWNFNVSAVNTHLFLKDEDFGKGFN
jgi:hypothetical protein